MKHTKLLNIFKCASVNISKCGYGSKWKLLFFSHSYSFFLAKFFWAQAKFLSTLPIFLTGALRNLPEALRKNCTLGILKFFLCLFWCKNIFALWHHVKNESDIADEAFFHLHDINTDGFIDKQELRWVFSYLLPNNYLLEL